MGTRSLTIIKNEQDKEICVMYRQYDGYPEGHGQELRDFVNQFTLVNGISFEDNRVLANGMNCLAAQLIAHFKTSVGGFYLYPPGTRDCWEEYTYYVYPKGKRVLVSCDESDEYNWYNEELEKEAE